MDARGTHILIDLYGASDPGGNCLSLLRQVAKFAECKVVWKKEHIFKKGGGRTAMLMLSTSHTSIHTWPERKYASFDLYSCRELSGETVSRIVELVRRMTFCDHSNVQVIPRGHTV